MKKIPFSPPDITEEEIEKVGEALRSGWITTGPMTKEFERQIAAFCGTERAVCLNSATACLELTLRVLGIGPGDEVITSAYTYTASASPVCHVGAKLVLVDTLSGSYEMDPEQLAAAITERTKAVIPVDLGGILADYDTIFSIVEDKKALFTPANDLQKKIGRVAVVADGAHSLGAVRRGKRSGCFADFTTCSFHAVKNLTTAEGGAATWNPALGLDNEAIYKQYMLLSLHGQSKDALAKNKPGAWEYDIVAPLYKCNMTDIMAAIGLVQLRRYPELLEKRYKLVRLYNELLSGCGVERAPHFREDERSSCHLYLARLTGKTMAQRNAVIEKMAEQGVATNVHYKPLPLLTAYKDLGFDIKDYPNAYAQFENEITLPLYSTLTEEDVRYICAALKTCLQD
mgnify:FL=1